MRQVSAALKFPLPAPAFPERRPTPATQRRTVLLLDGSNGAQLHTVPPVLLSGCECVTASNVETALVHLERVRPLMTLADARIFDTALGEDPLERLRSHPSHTGVPLVLLADNNTPTELVESAWRAGVTDCLMWPVSVQHVQERVAALSTEPAAVPERRAARVALVVDGDAVFRASLERELTLTGLRLLSVANEDEAVRRLASFKGVVDAVVVRGLAGAADVAALTRLRSLAALRGARGVLLAPKDSVQPGGLEAGVELLVREHTAPREIRERLEVALFRYSKDLHAHEAVPFFCPVQFRELGHDERWRSCYSSDISPGGLFLRTLVPARVGAAVELRIFLTTTGEVLEGSGVVSWGNPWAPGSWLVAPQGMGIQFLGMSPKRLGRLREICSAAVF